MTPMPSCFSAGDTIYFPFDTYDSSGGSVTITSLAVTDIEIYKNGSTTQRSSDNGYALLDTDGIDFDGTTGLHGFSVDTSDNSDAGFWVDGAQYWVNVNAITVDSQTVRFTYLLPLGLGVRQGTIKTLDALDTAQDSQHSTTQSSIAALNDITAADVWSHGTRVLTANTNLNDPTAAAIRTEIDSNSTQLALILTKLLRYTALQCRNDSAISTDLALEITDINQNFGTGAGNWDNENSALEQLDNELGIMDAKLDDIVDDTGELQTDWTNGGRLDLIVDAIKTVTDQVLPKLLAYFQLALRSDAAIGTDKSTELTAINTDEGSGAGDYSNQNESQEAIRDRGDTAWTGSGSGLSGSNTIDITIQSSADSAPIENASVRMHSTGNGDQTQETDSNGDVQFTVVSATWTIVINASEFDGRTVTLVVTDDTAITYQLTPSSGSSEVGFLG